MGYTHYWTHKRHFTKAQWAEVTEDVGAILKFAQHEMGIPLADGHGQARTSPVFTLDFIMFNGLGDDAHETMGVDRRIPPLDAHWAHRKDMRGWGFCKTAQKPYDDVVTAVLCYLSSIQQTHHVTSDGGGADFLEGLEVARRALPKYANMLDLPMGVMQADRWCSPWIETSHSRYDINFCVDGHGYVTLRKTGESLRFDTHVRLAHWLEQAAQIAARWYEPGPHRSTGFGFIPSSEQNLWKPSGSFDQQRYTRIGKLQNERCRRLFEQAASYHGVTAAQPPAYARPNQFPAPEHQPYYYEDFLKKEKVA